MRIATHCAPGVLGLIGQGYPSLRHAKQRSLAPEIGKLLSESRRNKRHTADTL
jgi:hypothetical protein